MTPLELALARMQNVVEEAQDAVREVLVAVKEAMERVGPDVLRYRVLLRRADGAELWIPDLALEDAQTILGALRRSGHDATFAAMP